jgi:predicted dehydrogenase/threonine dehydrogenase-like Zn-dependent dehydrogenase
MREVLQNYRTGKLTLEDVPMPSCSPGSVLVANRASLISSGTERGMLALARKNLVGKALARPDLLRLALDKAQREGYWKTFRELTARMDTPTPLGYSCAGVVVETGRRVERFRLGDRAACIGAGCASHAEIVCVPQNLCFPIPDELDFADAAFGMLGAIALHGVRCAECSLGNSVLVIGLGLLGLLAAQLLRASGCHAFGVDLDPAKVALARRLQVEGAFSGSEPWQEAVKTLTRGRGVDAVVVTAASDEAGPLQAALDAVRLRGTIVLVGTGKIDLPRQTMWEKEVRFLVSRASGPGALDPSYEAAGIDYPVAYVRWTQGRNVEEFLNLVAQGRVATKPLITHRFAIDRALEAYELIAKGGDGAVAVLLEYAAEASEERKGIVPLTPARPVARGEKGEVGVGVIGAGLFARAVLLPALSRVEGFQLRGVATQGGTSAHHIGKRFGFRYCTSDYRQILSDPNVECVFILTRHESHARLIQEAWRAGKAVFVEKPLALTEAEVMELSAEWEQWRGFLMVGFNRRYSSLVVQAARFLPSPNVPRLIHCRVNAGPVPRDHWVRGAAQGGGRIVSEVCHFVDLAQYWAGSPPTTVFADRLQSTAAGVDESEDIAAVISFANGSVANILYTASGHKAYSRERYEIFSGGHVAELDDFRRLRLVGPTRRRKVRRWNQDLGYEAELRTLLRTLRSGVPDVPFQEYVTSALATFRMREALAARAALPVLGDGAGQAVGGSAR